MLLTNAFLKIVGNFSSSTSYRRPIDVETTSCFYWKNTCQSMTSPNVAKFYFLTILWKYFNLKPAQERNELYILPKRTGNKSLKTMNFGDRVLRELAKRVEFLEQYQFHGWRVKRSTENRSESRSTKIRCSS